VPLVTCSHSVPDSRQLALPFTKYFCAIDSWAKRPTGCLVWPLGAVRGICLSFSAC